MSGRAFRKLQRAKETIPDQMLESEDEEISESIEHVGSKGDGKAKLNLFELLGGDDDDGDEEDEDNSDTQQVQEESSAQNSVHSIDKVKGKKNKGKGKKSKKDKTVWIGDGNACEGTERPTRGNDEFTLEELEESLRQLGEFPIYEHKLADNIRTPAKRYILSLDAKNMDPDVELRRIFGSKIVNEELNKRRYTKSTKRTLLSTPRDTWPRMDNIGLDMEFLTSDNGMSTYSFKHSARYQEIQKQFLMCLKTHDPTNISQLMQMYPAHVDSLLQFSEVMKHSGDIGLAGEIVERALHVFERSMHPSFNITSDAAKFILYVQRSLYIAIFRRIQFLGRSGCWRTALEFTKFLLNLDPINDPLGVYAMIDFYALKSGEYDFLLRLYQEHGEDYGLTHMPSFLYSVALARFHLESIPSNSRSSTLSSDLSASEDLQNAILQYPGLLQKIFAKNSVYLDQRFTKHPHVMSHVASPANLGVLYDLYTERSAALWKQPEVAEWAKSVLSDVLKRMDNKEDASIILANTVWQEEFVPGKFLKRRLYRHIVLSDYDLTSALPHELRNNIELHDPLPPPNVTHLYSEYIASLNGSGLGATAISVTSDPMMGFLRSLLPWVNGVEANDMMDHEAREVISNQADSVLEALRGLPDHISTAVRDLRLLERLGILANNGGNTTIPVERENDGNNNNNEDALP